jgi:hypothetical protein
MAEIFTGRCRASSGATVILTREEIENAKERQMSCSESPDDFVVVNEEGMPLANFILGLPAHVEIEHLNGNRLDFRRSNLRVVEKSQDRPPRCGR